MKSPCVAACKNSGGLCSGCFRTMAEIVQWRTMPTEQQDEIMAALAKQSTTHLCPSCQGKAQCDIQLGKSHCWCFDLPTREVDRNKNDGLCLCRQCLAALPVA